MAETYSLYDKDYCMPVFGLHNTGSICWFNSLLQAVFSLPVVNEKILAIDLMGSSGQSNDRTQHNEQKTNALVSCMQSVLGKCLPRSKKMIDPAATNIHQLEAASKEILFGFAVELQKNHKVLDIHSQEGAINGLCLFFEMLDDTEINNVIFNKYRKTIDCELCGKQTVSEVNEFSPIIDVFADSNLTTEDLFVNYIKRRLVPVYGYKCEHCGQTMNKTLRFEHIRRLSEVIIVAFQYCNGMPLPNSSLNVPPKYFPPTMSFLNADAQMMRYKAVAQIEHSGLYDQRTHTSSGHYYAKCTRNALIEPTDYYLLNDLSASPVPRGSTSNDVLAATQQTHMVFYHMYAVDPPTQQEQVKYAAVINKIKTSVNEKC